MKKLIVATLYVIWGGLVYGQSPCDTLPKITLQVSNATPCLGDSAAVTASGGVSYVWNNNVVNAVNFAPSNTALYTVTVTDTLGCVGTESVTIEVLPLPNIQANSSSLNICLGDSIVLEASNGVSYTWITPNIPNGGVFYPNQVGANIYTVAGSGTNGCTNTSQVIVVVKDNPTQPTVTLDSIATCLNVPFDATITATASIGRVFWFEDAALSLPHNDEDELLTDNTQVGVVHYYASAMQGGCYSTPKKVAVEVLPLPEISAGGDLTLDAGEDGNLQGDAPSNTTTVWSPTNDLTDPSSLTTAVTATNSRTYTLTVTDELGCVSTDAMQLTVNNVLTIANVLTPNADGDNDVWKLYPETTLKTCTVKLFDGFGRVLVDTDNYQNSWDGTFEGKELPDGDYYYHVKCANDIEEKGTVILIR